MITQTRGSWARSLVRGPPVAYTLVSGVTAAEMAKPHRITVHKNIMLRRQIERADHRVDPFHRILEMLPACPN